MDFILLYNTLNEELKFVIDRKKYFNKNLGKDVKHIMNDFMNSRIKYLNDIVIEL
jgi:hypothetical protein